ncbi:MAG: hypothetical protein IJ228_10480 [Succinivibrio sp.]|nr:hypothetical protein [Succinivibrio sp.]
MLRLKNTLWLLALGALTLAGPVAAAPDDGTFTINIQGPDEDNSAASQNATRAQRRTPARQPARVAQSQSAQNTQPAPVQTQSSRNQLPSPAALAAGTTYTVRNNDTIWSIANRHLPPDRSVNEFQVVASIYRNNPNAFVGGNVNNLKTGEIIIPPVSEIAREETSVGSRLLNNGSMTLPPLSGGGTTVAAAGSPTVAPAAAPAQTLGQFSAPGSNVAHSSPGDAADSNEPPVLTSEQIKAIEQRSQQQPNFTATETKLREIQQEQAAERSRLDKLPSNTLNSYDDAIRPPENIDVNDARPQNSTEAMDGARERRQKAEQEQEQANNQAAPAQEPLDIQAIRLMLDETRKAVDIKTKGLNKQLVDAIDRMKKGTQAAAKTAADDVANLTRQYDGIISEIQHNITELRGSLSRISQENGRLRDMLLATDDKIEELEIGLSNYKVDNQGTFQQPLMFILLGIGLLTLMLLTLFIFFKMKNRARNKTLHDDYSLDEMPADEVSGEDLLLSSTDENDSQVSDALAADSAAVASIPDDEPETAPAAAPAAAAAAPAAAAAAAAATTAPAPTAAQNAAEDNAADAWAAALNEQSAAEGAKSAEDNAADAWAAALNEQSAAESGEKSAEDNAADAWAAALNEQAAAEGGEKSAEDNAADAWAAALNEQSAAEGGEKSAEDNAADAWAAALQEQEGGGQSEEKSAEESAADAWAAALQEQEGGGKSEEKSAEESAADAWAAALNEQSAAESGVAEPSAEEQAMAAAMQQSSGPSAEEQAMAKAMKQAAAPSKPAPAAAAPKPQPQPSAVAESAADNVDLNDLAAEAAAESIAAETAEVMDEAVAESAAQVAEETAGAVDDAADLADAAVAEVAAAVDDVADAAADAADDLLEQVAEPEAAVAAEVGTEADELLAEAATQEAQPESEDADAQIDVNSVAEVTGEEAQAAIEDIDPAEFEHSDSAEVAEDAAALAAALEGGETEAAATQAESELEQKIARARAARESDGEPAKAEFASILNEQEQSEGVPGAIDTSDPDVADFEPQEAPAVGGSVNEVLNDDLDLESLLNEKEETAELGQEETELETVAEPASVPAAESEPDSEQVAEADVPETVPEDAALGAEVDLSSGEEQLPAQEDTAADESAVGRDETAQMGAVGETGEPASPAEDTESALPQAEAVAAAPETAVPEEVIEPGEVVEPEEMVEPEEVVEPEETAGTQSEALPDETAIAPELAVAEPEQSEVALEAAPDGIPFEEGDPLQELSGEAVAGGNDAIDQAISANAANLLKPAAEAASGSLNWAVPEDEGDDATLKHISTNQSEQDIMMMMSEAAPAEESPQLGGDEGLMNMLKVDDQATLESQISVSNPEAVAEQGLDSASDPLLPQPEETEELMPEDLSEEDELKPYEPPVSEETESAEAKEVDGLSPKEYQYFTDELNLARLYFETGDIDEARKIINEVNTRGNADLKAQAAALMKEYGIS